MKQLYNNLDINTLLLIRKTFSFNTLNNHLCANERKILQELIDGLQKELKVRQREENAIRLKNKGKLLNIN